MSLFPQALFLVPPSEISFISFFQLTSALPRSRAIVTVFTEPVSSLQAICMHRCFIKGFRQRRWQRRLWR